MRVIFRRSRDFINRLRKDAQGVILPYVAILLTVFVGMSALALDAGRWMSAQTQMQAIADALAIAGARELDQRPDSQTRATSAINNLVSNGLTGLGYSGSIAHSVAFYSALPADTAGYGGTAATSPQATKFVGVTVSPVTIPTILPVNFFSGKANTFTTAAQAIAGFKGRAVCDMPPVFICNPYETAGMSDNDATAALRTSLSNPAVTRKLIRMDQSQKSPGHFGFLVPPDRCTGANCLRDWIAKTHPSTCYQSPGVDLNTGAVNSVYDAFNVRFDLYQGNLNYTADYAPSVNVRKGYVPTNGGKNKWCAANPASQYPYLTLPIISATGTLAKSSDKVTVISPNTNAMSVNQLISDPVTSKIPQTPSGTYIKTKDSASQVTMSAKSSGDQASASLQVNWPTSGLPLDANMTDKTVIFGNGDWNCLDYWTINHKTAAAPTGCTRSNPTISRYQVYRYEIANNLVDDWSGDHQNNANGNNNPPSPTVEESGAPYCAGKNNGVDTSTGGPDRRIIYVAVINCLAQANLITGGQTADNIPVADFAKVFMTMPAGVGGAAGIDSSSIYGEVTGLVSTLDNVRILNQVQLYR